LVSTTPVSGSASPKCLAVTAASWPVIESTTNRVSTGLTAACSALISAIIASSMLVRPAVSTISTSAKVLRASAIAALTMASGFCDASDGKNSAPTWPASVCNCSIAAGR
jgi:hypothetical protein